MENKEQYKKEKQKQIEAFLTVEQREIGFELVDFFIDNNAAINAYTISLILKYLTLLKERGKIKISRKPKGYCPTCGNPLKFENIVISADTFGYPLKVVSEPYCPNCKSLVVLLPIKPDCFLTQWNIKKAEKGRIKPYGEISNAQNT
jgi:hypothetical protein